MAKRVQIKSWEDLQKNVGTITKRLNKDKNLLLAAAANPILALEELGYDITSDIVGFVEDKMRFGTKQVAQLKKLRTEIYKKSGAQFNIRSESELQKTLFEDLEIEAFDDRGCPISKAIGIPKKGDENDPLKAYETLHPVISPLLSFRELDASIAGFCDAHTYKRIRTGNYGEKSNLQLKIQLKK